MVKKTTLRQKLFKIMIRIQQFLGINIINESGSQAQQDQERLYRKSEIEMNTKELKQEKDLALTGKRKNWTKVEIEAAHNSINSQTSPKFLKEAEDLFKKPVIVSNLPPKKSEINKDSNNTSSEKLAGLFRKRVEENLRNASDEVQSTPEIKNQWKRKDFFALNLGPGSVGNHYTIEGTEIKLISFIGYTWQKRSPKTRGDMTGFTRHPISKTLWILLSFDKMIREKIAGIDIQLHGLGFYTCGPCGYYGEVYGNIGDKKIFARAILSGTGCGGPPIEIISQGNYIFFVDHSIDRFSLSVFENLTTIKSLNVEGEQKAIRS
jgi:hypothetical protein